MKNYLRITGIMAAILLFAVLTGTTLAGQVKAGDPGKQNPVPADIMKVFQRSCSKCHIDGAMGGLRFTDWDSYKGEKQAAKAQAICKELSSNAMPPARFLKNNPSLALTQEEKKTICDWAASLKPAKK